MKLIYESPEFEFVKISFGEVLLNSPDEKPTSGGTIIEPNPEDFN